MLQNTQLSRYFSKTRRTERKSKKKLIPPIKIYFMNWLALYLIFLEGKFMANRMSGLCCNFGEFPLKNANAYKQKIDE
jgi:hypothetical protein